MKTINIFNKHLVTVAIPTYNRPEGLRRTLECITRQTYKNLEILVSDNCTEGENGARVHEIMQDFLKKDNRIVFFKQDMNIYAENFPFLLNKSSADFFMWAADDDYWENTFIELCLQRLLDNEKFSAVFTYFSTIDLLGHRVRFFNLHNFGLKTFNKTFKLCFEHEFMGKANVILALYRKERLVEALKINPFSPWEPFADVNIVMAAHFMGGIGIVPKLCFYKTHSILHPYRKRVDEVSACRVPVVTCWENKVYVKRLLLSALKYNAFIPTFLALFTRCVYETYFRFYNLLKRGYRFFKS